MNEKNQEFLSPFPGMAPYRRAYETKQYEVLSSEANLIELDLLQSGQWLLPSPELADAAWAEERLRVVGLRQL